MSDVNSISFTQQETGLNAPEQTQTQLEQSTEQRPGWLPENFRTPQDLATSYKALQAELTRVKQEATQDTQQGVATGSADASDVQVREMLSDNQLNYDEMVEFYSSNGHLSDDHYRALEGINIPRSIVDDYIEAKQAQVDTIRTSLLNEVGGEERFQQLAQFARQHYTDAQLKTYNDAVESRDYERIAQAVKALNAAYENKRGSAPTYLGSENVSSTSGYYRDMSEFLADVGSEKYKTSEAFRADVEAKLMKSKL